MAVPSGKYEVRASVDLSPVFGEIAASAAIDVTVPDEKVLDERLRQLKSGDPNVRRTAVIDLRYFKRDADVVAPALVALLDDEDMNVRRIAVSVLMSYPDHAAKHHDKFMVLLVSEDVSMRYMAAQILGRTAPADPANQAAIEAALVKALEESPENYKRVFESSLTNYRNRTKAAAK